jgi:hypothetical protein
MNPCNGEKKGAISAAEKMRRKEANDFTIANLGLSGFIVSEEVQALSQSFVNGEIDRDELNALMMQTEKTLDTYISDGEYFTESPEPLDLSTLDEEAREWIEAKIKEIKRKRQENGEQTE